MGVRIPAPIKTHYWRNRDIPGIYPCASVSTIETQRLGLAEKRMFPLGVTYTHCNPSYVTPLIQEGGGVMVTQGRAH